MPRGIQLTIVCEDILHEVFARAFLYRRGFRRHDLRFEKAPSGKQDAKQCVRERFPTELAALRRYGGAGRGLLCITDSDNLTPVERANTLHECCARQNVAPPAATELVFIFTPKWEIENWLAWLRDGACDETSNAYDKYRNREADIYPLVEHLADMCMAKALNPQPAPPSLLAACSVFAGFQTWVEDSNGGA